MWIIILIIAYCQSSSKTNDEYAHDAYPYRPRTNFLVFINKFSLIAIGSFTFSWGKPLKIATFLTYKELHGVFFFNLALKILPFLFVYCEQLIFNGVCLTKKKSINETKKSINYGIQINYRISQRPFSCLVYMYTIRLVGFRR